LNYNSHQGYNFDFPALDNGDESILKNDEYNDVKYGFMMP
jgi:hypothetical protein